MCYSRYELGKRDLPTEVLIALARFYGTSTDYLLGLDGRKTLDVSGLPLSVVGHLQLLIEDIKAK